MGLAVNSFVYSSYSWLNFDLEVITAHFVTDVIFPENVDLDECLVLLNLGSIIHFKRMLPKNVFLPHHLLPWESQWHLLTGTGNVATVTGKQGSIE